MTHGMTPRLPCCRANPYGDLALLSLTPQQSVIFKIYHNFESTVFVLFCILVLYRACHFFLLTGRIETIVGYFKGCLRDIHIGNQRLHYLDNELQPGVTITNIAVQPGCQGDDVCSINKCPSNAFCKDMWNRFECECLPGWEGTDCSISSDDCRNHQCFNAATCVDGYQTYTCRCLPGYAGDFCETLLYACDESPCDPKNTISCTSIFPSDYLCSCRPGFEGKNCSVDVDDCVNNMCADGSTCVDQINSYSCLCEKDRLGDMCQNTRVCASEPCYNGGSCTPTLDNANYTCTCPNPYIGEQCQTFNTCFVNDCQNGASCVTEENTYSCECQTGFYGHRCQYTDACLAAPCKNSGVCTTVENSHICKCTIHYTGRDCQTAINKCAINRCFNGAQCFFNTSDPENSFECLCLPGFEGDFCQFDIDECLSSPCTNGGTCIESNSRRVADFVPGYTCTCAMGYLGDHCEIDFNECDSSPCQNGGSCFDRVNQYECSCLDGFLGETCELDQRGCGSSPCQNKATCNQLADTFTCVCPTGYEGTFCETNTDDCEGNKCVHGAECIDEINTYSCKCLPGYGGVFCENVLNACFRQPCKNGGNCTYISLCSCTDVLFNCGWLDEDCQRRDCLARTDCLLYPQPFLCGCDGTGFQGPTCGEDFNECNDNFVCRNGARCVNTPGSFSCDCDGTGYIGSRCDIDINECIGFPNICFRGRLMLPFTVLYKLYNNLIFPIIILLANYVTKCKSGTDIISTWGTCHRLIREPVCFDLLSLPSMLRVKIWSSALHTLKVKPIPRRRKNERMKEGRKTKKEKGN